jgi:tetratricopeptide (TPR) repeat protein
MRSCLAWALAAALATEGFVGLARAADTESEAKPAPEVAEPELDPAVFDEALGRFHDQDWAEAAVMFFGYLRVAGPNADNREWAQYFLAESLASLGFWHAAVHYYSIVAKTRSRPEILPQALARLEAISRQRPLDETLVLGDVIYDSEFGALPENLSDFVNYIQGLLDYRHGFVRWGERHFASISPKGAYALKARFVRATYALKEKQDDKAVALFEEILESPVDDADTKNKAHLGLARLLYDLGRYADALKEYDKVKQIELSFEQAQVLVEKAWAAYQIHEPRRSLGYLHALDAPSYQRYFLSDIYLLRALILKEFCQYIPAKRALRSFRFRFGSGLDELRRRAPLTQNQVVFDGTTQAGPIARRTALIKSLERERKLVDDYESQFSGVELDKHLARLYDLELKEQGRLWRQDFTEHADAVARDLLDAEEQVNLLDYEIGLDIFKRLKVDVAKQSVEEQLVVPYDSTNVYYEFDDEFWNDELHDYQVFVTDRCFEAEGKR